jgi:hypothetical protein
MLGKIFKYMAEDGIILVQLGIGGGPICCHSRDGVDLYSWVKEVVIDRCTAELISDDVRWTGKVFKSNVGTKNLFHTTQVLGRWLTGVFLEDLGHGLVVGVQSSSTTMNIIEELVDSMYHGEEFFIVYGPV